MPNGWLHWVWRGEELIPLFKSAIFQIFQFLSIFGYIIWSPKYSNTVKRSFAHFRIGAFFRSSSSTRTRIKGTTAAPWTTPTSTGLGVRPRLTQTGFTSKEIGVIVTMHEAAQILRQVIHYIFLLFVIYYVLFVICYVYIVCYLLIGIE